MIYYIFKDKRSEAILPQSTISINQIRHYIGPPAVKFQNVTLNTNKTNACATCASASRNDSPTVDN